MMRVVTVITVVFLVALVIVNEAKPFGRRGQGNRKGHRDHDSDRSECRFRCRRPTHRSRVCAFDGLQNLTFPSACHVERIACKKQRNITIVAEGACSRVRAANVVGLQGTGGNKESESGEISNSLESNEVEETLTTTRPTSTLATSPSTESSTSVVTMTSGSTPGTNETSGPTNPSTPPSSPVASTSAPATASPGPAVTGPAVTGPGTTCVTACPVSPNPVCGTDGATYPSACVLESYACVNQIEGLVVASQGPC